jgi:hypothetical protein
MKHYTKATDDRPRPLPHKCKPVEYLLERRSGNERYQTTCQQLVADHKLSSTPTWMRLEDAEISVVT